ncbi:hypothetical protein [Bartonella schoenbuchensis]|nr:hypothetical protein [Bartonella schoenbuchensis]
MCSAESTGGGGEELFFLSDGKISKRFEDDGKGQEVENGWREWRALK